MAPLVASGMKMLLGLLRPYRSKECAEVTALKFIRLYLEANLAQNVGSALAVAVAACIGNGSAPEMRLQGKSFRNCSK